MMKNWYKFYIVHPQRPEWSVMVGYNAAVHVAEGMARHFGISADQLRCFWGAESFEGCERLADVGRPMDFLMDKLEKSPEAAEVAADALVAAMTADLDRSMAINAWVNRLSPGTNKPGTKQDFLFVAAWAGSCTPLPKDGVDPAVERHAPELREKHRQEYGRQREQEKAELKRKLLEDIDRATLARAMVGMHDGLAWRAVADLWPRFGEGYDGFSLNGWERPYAFVKTEWVEANATPAGNMDNLRLRVMDCYGDNVAGHAPDDKVVSLGDVLEKWQEKVSSGDFREAFAERLLDAARKGTIPAYGTREDLTPEEQDGRAPEDRWKRLYFRVRDMKAMAVQCGIAGTAGGLRRIWHGDLHTPFIEAIRECTDSIPALVTGTIRLCNEPPQGITREDVVSGKGHESLPKPVRGLKPGTKPVSP